MSNFAAALKNELDSKPKPLGFLEERALRIVSDPDRPRHARLIERWERKSKAALEFDPSGIIDWFKQVDWVKVLQIVLAILGILLMFLGPQPDDDGVAAVGPEATEVAWFPGKKILLHFVPDIVEELGLPAIREAVKDADVFGIPLQIGYDEQLVKAKIIGWVERGQQQRGLL